jgi:hypothetical protein
MLHPVPDLRVFLLGAWRIVRRIDDTRLRQVGRLTGRGIFETATDGLAYDEAGALCFGNYRGEATRRYLLVMDGPGICTVRHAGGGLFHKLDLSSGRADINHWCGEDRYRGRYRILDQNGFVVAWDVAGPRKRYRMATVYTRQRTAREGPGS